MKIWFADFEFLFNFDDICGWKFQNIIFWSTNEILFLCLQIVQFFLFFIDLDTKSWQRRNATEKESATQWEPKNGMTGCGGRTNWRPSWKASSAKKKNEKVYWSTTRFQKIIGSSCSIIENSSPKRLKNMQRTIIFHCDCQWSIPGVWGMKRRLKLWKTKNLTCWRKDYGAGQWHGQSYVTTWGKPLQVTWWSRTSSSGCGAKNSATSKWALSGFESMSLRRRKNDNPTPIKKLCSSGWKIRWWSMGKSSLLTCEKNPNFFWKATSSRITNTFKNSAVGYGNILVGRQADAKVSGFLVRVCNTTTGKKDEILNLPLLLNRCLSTPPMNFHQRVGNFCHQIMWIWNGKFQDINHEFLSKILCNSPTECVYRSEDVNDARFMKCFTKVFKN